MDKKSYVTASEIGEFVFCRRGWWLRQNGEGVITDAMLAGTKAHNRLFTAVRMHKKKVILAATLLVIGLLILSIIYFFGGSFT